MMSHAQVHEDEFMKGKPTEIDSAIQAKMTALLGGYECFKQDVIGAAGDGASLKASLGYFNGPRHGHHHGGHHHGAHHHGGHHHGHHGGHGNRSSHSHGGQTHRSSRRHRHAHGPGGPGGTYGADAAPGHHPHHPSAAPMTFERRVQSVLNKLTRQNYKKLVASLLEQLKDDDVEALIEHILRKCYTQTCFLDLFVRLLVDLHASCTDENRRAIDRAIDVFVQGFVNNRDMLLFRIKGGTEDYGQFCDTMMQRNHIVGKHKTILSLIRSNMHESSGAVYLDAIMRILNESDDAPQDAYELLLDFMMDFVKFDAQIAAKVQRYFADTSDADNTGACGKTQNKMSNKAKFKIRDILSYVHA